MSKVNSTLERSGAGGAGKVCICEICTCGRHHCRHQSARGSNLGKCSYETTNRIDFQGRDGTAARPKSCKPVQEYEAASAPFVGTTTSQQDFPAWKVQTAPFKKPKEAYVAPAQRFEAVTSNQLDYRAKGPVPRTASCKPINVRAEPERGEYV